MKERIFRARRNKIVAGVCSGLGEYFNIDPVIVRILFVVLTIMNGIGILIYILLWIMVPEESFEKAFGLNDDIPPANPFENKSDENQNTTEGTASNNWTNDGSSIPDYNIPLPKRTDGRLIAGSILIIIGALFLIDDIIPSFNFSDLFPILLILAGAFFIYNSKK
ncbi:MAG: PspC domain-containing protein [Melioribacteraceae bacterium]|nr:PspC domain-containing protein [Melioribacteraceae bacterium]